MCSSDLSLLPVGVDCNGKGWVMGEGSSAHCMCDEGYERPNGDYLSCVLEGSADGEETNPHEDSLGNYEIGQPYLSNVKVTAKIVEEVKGTKLSILRFRRRKHSMRKQGHRAKYTKIEIDKIKLESK